MKVPINQKKFTAIELLFVVLTAILLFMFSFGIGLKIAEAQETGVTASVRFNNDNIHTSIQPAPVSSGYDFGDMQIIPLEDGKTLMVYRYILDPEYGVNIWRYELDDAFWFITNKGVIWGTNSVGMEPMASTSLQALSIYLTL